MTERTTDKPWEGLPTPRNEVGEVEARTVVAQAGVSSQALGADAIYVPAKQVRQVHFDGIRGFDAVTGFYPSWKKPSPRRRPDSWNAFVRAQPVPSALQFGLCDRLETEPYSGAMLFVRVGFEFCEWCFRIVPAYGLKGNDKICPTCISAHEPLTRATTLSRLKEWYRWRYSTIMVGRSHIYLLGDGTAGRQKGQVALFSPLLDAPRLESMYAGRCAYCGEGSVDGRDHMLPQSRRGHDIYENTVPCCATCNSRKWTMTTPEFLDSARCPPMPDHRRIELTSRFIAYMEIHPILESEAVRSLLAPIRQAREVFDAGPWFYRELDWDRACAFARFPDPRKLTPGEKVVKDRRRSGSCYPLLVRAVEDDGSRGGQAWPLQLCRTEEEAMSRPELPRVYLDD